MSKLFFGVVHLFMSLGAYAYSVCEAERINSQKAQEMIEIILKKEPQNIECMLQLANIYLKQGKIDKGFETLVNAYSIDPHYVKESAIASVLPFALKVTTLRQQASKINDREIWNQLGDGYYEMGIFVEAAQMYKNSIHVDSSQVNIRLKYAFSLQKSGQIYSALEELRTILRNNPNHVYANYYMGKMVLYDIKKWQESQDYFARAKASLIAQKDDFAYLEYTNLLSDITKELGE